MGAAGLFAARHFWPVATCLSTAAAVVLAFLVWNERSDLAERSSAASDAEQPSTELVETVPIQPRNVNNPSVSPSRWGGLALPSAPKGTYLALRNQMLTTPADQWPMPPSVDGDARRGSPDPADDRQPPTSRNLLREFLPLEPGTEPARRGPDPARRGSPDPAGSPAAQTTELEEAIT